MTGVIDMMTEQYVYDSEWVRQFYDDYGEREWDRMVRTPADEVMFHVHRSFLEQHVRAGDRVLEIGPGPGRFTQVLADLGARIVQVDVSQVQLDLNRRHAEELGFDLAVVARVRGDVCSMPWIVEGTFDAVVAFGGPLSYVLDRREPAVREMLRVVRPGGAVLLSAPTPRDAVGEWLTECGAEVLETAPCTAPGQPDADAHPLIAARRPLRAKGRPG